MSSFDPIAWTETRFSQLAQQHQLTDWCFQWDRAKRRAGCCKYEQKVISVSINFVQAVSKEEIEDTLLHEMAHALVGAKHHHDAVWRKKALEIGCSGERCHAIEFTKAPYALQCTQGCWSVPRFRRMQLSKIRRMRCAKCQAPIAMTSS